MLLTGSSGCRCQLERCSDGYAWPPPGMIKTMTKCTSCALAYSCRLQGCLQGEPLMTADLSTCGMESALMVLLAWACSFSQALQQGAKFEAEEVIISVGDSLRCLQTSQASCCSWSPHSD